MNKVTFYILPGAIQTNADIALVRLLDLGYDATIVNASNNFQVNGEFPGGPITVILNEGTAESRFVTVSETFDIDNLVNFVQSELPDGNGGAGGDDANDSLGLPIGGNLFDFDIPKFAFLVLGVVATYKSLDSQKTLGQVGFGAAAAYSWTKYLQQ